MGKRAAYLRIETWLLNEAVTAKQVGTEKKKKKKNWTEEIVCHHFLNFHLSPAQKHLILELKKIHFKYIFILKYLHSVPSLLSNERTEVRQGRTMQPRSVKNSK